MIPCFAAISRHSSDLARCARVSSLRLCALHERRPCGRCGPGDNSRLRGVAARGGVYVRIRALEEEKQAEASGSEKHKDEDEELRGHGLRVSRDEEGWWTEKNQSGELVEMMRSTQLRTKDRRIALSRAPLQYTGAR